MRVLVCGSRTFDNADAIIFTLEGILHFTTSEWEELVIIEGDATGADIIAGDWTDSKNREIDPFGNGVPYDPDGPSLIEHLKFPADWDKYGKAAGPIRNQQMLNEGKPDIVFAFVDKPLVASRGTAHMVSIARGAGLPVYVTEKI